MAKTAWTLDTIEVDVTGFFTTHHYLQTEEGSLGEFNFPAFSQGGTYRTADGREMLMQKTHWLHTSHELVEGGRVRGTADRRGIFSREIDIQYNGQSYTLQPEGGFGRQGWYLIDAQGLALIEIQPRGVFRQGAFITITAALDADLAAFAYYLVHMRRQEDAAASAAAS